MKRLQILIEEELDDALAIEAKRTGTSKAALIRRFVRDQLSDQEGTGGDPLAAMIGVDELEPTAVDDVVYR